VKRPSIIEQTESCLSHCFGPTIKYIRHHGGGGVWMGGGEAQKNRADAILMSLIEGLSCTWSVFLCVSFCLGWFGKVV